MRSLQAIDAAIARVTRAVDAAVPKVPQSGFLREREEEKEREKDHHLRKS